MKYMHPRKSITERYPKTSAQQHLTDLVALRQEVKVINRKEA